MLSLVIPRDVVLDLIAAAILDFYKSLDSKAETCSALALENACRSSSRLRNSLSVPGLSDRVFSLLSAVLWR